MAWILQIDREREVDPSLFLLPAGSSAHEREFESHFDRHHHSTADVCFCHAGRNRRVFGFESGTKLGRWGANSYRWEEAGMKKLMLALLVWIFLLGLLLA